MSEIPPTRERDIECEAESNPMQQTVGASVEKSSSSRFTNISIVLVVFIGMVVYHYNYYGLLGLPQTAEVLSATRFREANFTSMFPLHDVDVIRDFDFNDCPHRLAVVVHPNQTKQVWVARPCSGSIFTVDTDTPSTNQITFPQLNQFQPKAVHQVNINDIAIASESGLFLADTSGSIGYLIMEGKYSDVAFDGVKIYVLEYDKNLIKAAHMNESSSRWEEDRKFSIALNSDCDHQHASCHDRFRTFLVYKKFFYVTSATGFKILKYNRVGQKTESFNHDHLLPEQNTSVYSGFSISAIDAKKVLALCNIFGTEVFLRKNDNKLHGNKFSSGIKHIWDIVIFQDDVYVLWGKTKYTLTHLTRQNAMEYKTSKCNPQNTDNKYTDMRNIKGNFHLLLGKLDTRRQKDVVQLSGVSHRLGVVQFGTTTELWVPVTKKHFIQVYTLQGIKSDEFYYPDFDYLYPIAVLQVQENEIILASEYGLYCLDNHGVIQYKLTDGKFSDVTFDQRRLITMDYKNNRVIRFSRQQGVWVENAHLSFHIKNLHLHSDSYNTLVVQGKHTYIASSTKYQVQKYSITGILLDTYQSEQRKASQRMRQSLTVSGIDDKATILLCDFYNNQLLTLSADGRFTKYQLADLGDIRDAVIVKKTMYILSGIANHKITAVPLH